MTILWRRWCAAVIDWIVILISVGCLLVWIDPTWRVEVIPGLTVFAFHLLFGLAYFTLLEHRHGVSTGKWLMGLRVVTYSDAPPGSGRAAGRAAIAWAVPTLASDLAVALPFPVFVAALVVPAALLFVPARRSNGFQAWHDRWTGTRLIRDESGQAALPYAAVSLAMVSIVARVLALTQGYRAGLFWAVAAVGLAGIATSLALKARRAGSIIVTTLIFATLLVQAMADYANPPLGGNDPMAIGSLRAISSAQSTYAAICADGGYATDLADLGRVPRGTGEAFISKDLSANGVVKSGYVLTVSREASPGVVNVGSPEKTCNGSLGQPVSGYVATASPVSRETGRRHFATDSRGIIFFSWSGPIPNPIPPGTSFVW
jgi:uncharacterized RDD family membrane protein YckC